MACAPETPHPHDAHPKSQSQTTTYRSHLRTGPERARPPDRVAHLAHTRQERRGGVPDERAAISRPHPSRAARGRAGRASRHLSPTPVKSGEGAGRTSEPPSLAHTRQERRGGVPDERAADLAHTRQERRRGGGGGGGGGAARPAAAAARASRERGGCPGAAHSIVSGQLSEPRKKRREGGGSPPAPPSLLRLT